MANLRLKVPESIEGDFFVDTTCINCDTCRQLAPETFGDTGEFSYVRKQPDSDSEIRSATQALLACPVGSIGTLGENRAKEVMQDFPLPIVENIAYCGFTSPESFGASSYFIRHPQGNWLVDSPRFLPHLVKRFEEAGGLDIIFLTHRDDVAAAALYAKHFGARRVIHDLEKAVQPDAEILIEGGEPVEVAPGFKVIPTPGHTQGHCVLLYQNRFLFSGDHLWWNPEGQTLGASRRACWYSWAEQTRSMERLLEERFEWVLPGHGDRHYLPAEAMHEQLSGLVSRMKQ